MNMLDQNLVILTLEYSYLTNASASTCYQSNNGLWRDYLPTETIIQNPLGISYQIIDNLLPLRKVINEINFSSSNGNFISLVAPQSNNQFITVSINGSKDFIISSRAKILKKYNQVSYKSIKLSKNEFTNLDHRFLIALDKLSRYYNVEIIVNNNETDFKSTNKISTNYSIYILGNQDNITIVESRTRILIDTVINNFYLDSIDIDLSMIPLIGGVELFNFNEIAKQSSSNIYIPDLLPELFNSNILSSNYNLKIYITSKEIPEITLSKIILKKLINQIDNEFIVKEVDLTKVKIDLITLLNQSAILNIMFKYGTFIQLPSLGEIDNFKLIVQGQSIESINETIHELTLLSSCYYTININFNNQFFNNELEYYLINLVQLKSCCVITYNQFGIEINGQNKEIKQILSNLNSNNYFWNKVLNDFEIRIRLELNNNQKDFISGKKNGKIIKILNQLNQIPIIKFSPFNEYNFYIDLSVRNDISLLIKGIELIELELPAELKFNIPEVFHKSIIGNGGSIIQSIMKKHNVFIKFSSSVNHHDKIFFSFKRFNNVFIKCPQKNAKNIILVKNEIDHLVQHCCLNNTSISSSTTVYHTIEFQLLKSHYLMLINNNKLKSINNLENDNNSFIDFPSSIGDFKGRNQMMVQIKGSDFKSKQCALKLEELLPYNFEFKLTYSPGKFGDLDNESNREFNERIIIPFKVLLGVELICNEVPIGSDNTSYHQIILSYYSTESIETAINDLTLYLREKKFLILDKQEFKFSPIIESPMTSSTTKNHVANKLKPITNQVNNSNYNYNLKRKQSFIHETKISMPSFNPVKQNYNLIDQAGLLNYNGANQYVPSIN